MVPSACKLFAGIDDPRVVGRTTHSLAEILFAALCATLCGFRCCNGYAQFARAKVDFLRRYLPYEDGTPSHDTFGRLLRLIRPEQFEPEMKSPEGAHLSGRPRPATAWPAGMAAAASLRTRADRAARAKFFPGLAIVRVLPRSSPECCPTMHEAPHCLKPAPRRIQAADKACLPPRIFPHRAGSKCCGVAAGACSTTACWAKQRQWRSMPFSPFFQRLPP